MASTDLIAGGEQRLQRRWDDLSRDVLVLIFSRLGVVDLIAGASLVCSSWREAALDPTCWRVIDLRKWHETSRRLRRRRRRGRCRDGGGEDFADLLRLCIENSADFVDEIYLPELAGEIDLEFISLSCPGLLYLSIENPEIAENAFCDAISKLKFLEGMAIHEDLICDEVLQQVGNSCVNFSKLKLFADVVGGELASSICKFLPHLRKLELPNCTIRRESLLTFLDGLKDLEYLDISGYENAGIAGVVLEKAARLKVFKWDSEFDEGDFDYCPDCGKDYVLQNPSTHMFDKEVSEWLPMEDDFSRSSLAPTGEADSHPTPPLCCEDPI